MVKSHIPSSFGLRDVVYIVGGALSLVAHYYAIKIEMQAINNRQVNYESVTNLRLNYLEGSREKQTSFYQRQPTEAILPNEVKIK